MIFVIVAVAAFGAGLINAVAGGGTFLTFPALIAAGLPPIDANASNTAALFPGQIATGYAARDGLAAASADSRVNVPVLAAISLVGGFLGGILLLITPNPFSAASCHGLFCSRQRYTRAAIFTRLAGKVQTKSNGIFAVQGLVAIYGGYFGGGAGILVLSAFTLFGLRDMWLMNSLKILVVTLINAAAVITFIAAGLVHWHWTILVAVGAIAGGFAGLHAARRVPAHIAVGFVVAVGLVLTIYFFVKPA